MPANKNLTDTSPGKTTPKADKRKRTFASTVKKGNNMCMGINEHKDILSPRGLNKESIRRLETLIKNCQRLRNEREILKGKLKEKTGELHQEFDALNKTLAEYGMIVKAIMPQETWVAFGITAKR